MMKMPGPSRRLPFLSIILYSSFVLILVYLAVFAQGFSLSFLDVRLSGRYKPIPLFGTRKIRELTLSYNGLEIYFSRADTLAFEIPGEGIKTHAVESLSTYSDGADILFEGGIAIRLRSASGSKGAYTLAVDDANGRSGSTVAVPFRVRAEIKKSDAAPILSWSLKEKSYILSLPVASRVDSGAGRLLLAAGSGGIRFGSTEPSLDDPYASWLSIESPLSDRVYQERVSAFADGAFAAWTKSLGSADSAVVFREQLGQALIAESIARGSYMRHRSAYQQVLGRRLQHDAGPSLKLTSSPYIGNLAEYVRRLQNGEAGDIDAIRTRLASSDMAIFDFPGIVPFLLDHGPFSLVQEVLALLEDSDRPVPEVSSVLGMLEACLDCLQYLDASAPLSSRASAIIERRILPSISKTDRGILLVEKKGSPVDVRDNLNAAYLLNRAVGPLKLPVLDSIARGLLSASLGLQGDGAALPAFVTLSGNSVTATRGSLPPETVYDLVMTDRYLPEEVPLYRTLGPGTWIWTAARLEAAEGKPESLTLTLSFPAGLPHYLVLQGIKSIGQITLHGTDWRPDKGYSQYSDGWTYDAEGKTLFLKVTNKQEKEQIVISY